MKDAVISNPIKAIRAKCLDCSNYSTKEVRLCPIETCALYPFRFGKNPFRKVREMSDEEKHTCGERLARGRAKNSL